MLSYKELKMFKQQVNYTFCIQVTELAMWAYFYLQLMTFALGIFCNLFLGGKTRGGFGSIKKKYS